MNVTERTAAELATLGEVFRQYDGQRIAHGLIKRGGSVLDFHNEIDRHVGRMDLDRAMGLDLSDKDLRYYSLTRAIRAFINPHGSPRHDAPFEYEVSDEIERQTGRSHGSIHVPWSVFRDFNTGATEAGAFIASSSIEGGFVGDPFRNALAFGKLGATIAGGFKNDFTVPRFTSDVSGAFLAEVAAASEASPATAQVTFAAERYSAYVEPSRQALVQSTPALESYLRRQLIQSAMSLIEESSINGSGGSPSLTGIRANTGIGTVVGGANGAQLAFSHLADLEAKAGTANAPDLNPGFLVNSASRRWLRTQPRGTGLPYTWEGGERPLVGFRAAVSGNMPSNLSKGTSTAVCSSVLFGSDWSLALLALFGSPAVTVDTTTMAPTGQARITIDVFAAFGLLQPGAFAKMDDALTT